MKLQRNDLLVFIVLTAIAAASGATELNVTQGIAFWGNNQKVPVRKTSSLTVLAPIPASIDSSPSGLVEVACAVRVSRNNGERGVKGARGRYTTYAYALDAASASFEKILLASGEIKTARDGWARWTTEVPTGPGTMWSVSDLVWINRRKAELTFLSCSFVDQPDTGATLGEPQPPRR